MSRVLHMNIHKDMISSSRTCFSIRNSSKKESIIRLPDIVCALCLYSVTEICVDDIEKIREMRNMKLHMNKKKM